MFETQLVLYNKIFFLFDLFLFIFSYYLLTHYWNKKVTEIKVHTIWVFFP